MKRSAALAPLSRDHHAALVIARELSRAGEHQAAAAAERFVSFLADHELVHFSLEERVLLPSLPEQQRGRELGRRVLEDHEELRSAMDRLRDPGNVSVELVNGVGRRLREHVRLEEQELFPYLESSLDPAALEQIGVRLREREREAER